MQSRTTTSSVRCGGNAKPIALGVCIMRVSSHAQLARRATNSAKCGGACAGLHGLVCEASHHSHTASPHSLTHPSESHGIASRVPGSPLHCIVVRACDRWCKELELGGG